MSNKALITKQLRATGERLPLVGLGSWITFNVGRDPKLLSECTKVIGAFFDAGGRMIDCSPMYGSSQATIGYALKKLGNPKSLFSAEKVWTSTRGQGQIKQTQRYWGIPRFDLLQVHNLVAWEKHLPMLAEMKAQGRLRYIGITTSHGLRHNQVKRILTRHPIDFVQVTYNAVDREVEQQILPIANERGIAVIVNRPFRQKQLVRKMERHPLPGWAKEAGASSWAQFLLKFVISHPAVTCAIPATTRVDHVRENLSCASGTLPDKRLRKRMADYVSQF